MDASFVKFSKKQIKAKSLIYYTKMSNFLHFTTLISPVQRSTYLFAQKNTLKQPHKYQIRMSFSK